MTVPKWQSSNWLSNHRFLFRTRAIIRRGLSICGGIFLPMTATADFGLFLPVLGGNGKFSSKPSFVLTLFYGEKRSKSRSRLKRRRESVATGGFCPEHDFLPLKRFFKIDHLLLRCVHVTYGKIAARQARGYGVLYKI